MRKLITFRLDEKTIERLKKIQGSKTEFVEKAIVSRINWFERKEAIEKSEGFNSKIEAIIEAAQKKWKKEGN